MESIKLAAEYVSHLPVVAKIAPALSNRRGVAALEYGLIASLIAVVIITAVSTLGENSQKAEAITPTLEWRAVG